MDCSLPGSSFCGDFPGKNTGVGCHALLQRIFPTQGSNPGLPHCRWILYHLSHQGSPRILEWVPSLFCRGSSWPRNQTRVSCIAGGFFTSWATNDWRASTGLRHFLQSGIWCQICKQKAPHLSRCKLVYIEGINKVLLYSTGTYIQYPGINHDEKNMKKLCMCITESLYWTAEINITL